jgi:hypothetical protein
MELSQILFNHFKQNGIIVRKSSIPYMEVRREKIISGKYISHSVRRSKRINYVKDGIVYDDYIWKSSELEGATELSKAAISYLNSLKEIEAWNGEGTPPDNVQIEEERCNYYTEDYLSDEMKDYYESYEDFLANTEDYIIKGEDIVDVAVNVYLNDIYATIIFNTSKEYQDIVTIEIFP